MNRHMVQETGSRFLELASSLGRIHVDALDGMADATAKTPLGAIFAANASLARMASEGMETLATRMNAEVAPATDAPAKAASKPKKAKKPAAFAVETPPVEAIEPDIADVLIEEPVAKQAKAPAKAKAAPTAAAKPDDLTAINGIGATTAKKLNKAGIETFAQIAGMTDAKFEALLATLDIKSIRFTPAYWIGEAKKLTA